MSKDDEAERKTFGGIIPARPKGATAPKLDEFLGQRRQTMQGPARINFEEPEPEPEGPAQSVYADPFEAFVEMMRLMRRIPKKARKQVIELIADLLD